MQDVFMYIQKLIETLHPFGDVLEVGFGKCSEEIQKYHPKSHTIITTDSKAHSWAKKHPTVKIVDDIWQGALPSLGVFDTLFFGIDPVESPFLAKMKYSESDVDVFCKTVTEKEALSRFLSELEQNGQIDLALKEKMIKKYHLSHEKPPAAKRSGQMLDFLKHCIDSHMRKKSRFSCFLKSELDDPQFFDEIIVNPFLDYREDGRIIVIEKLG
ncbi:MAG: hypothetical protein COT85_00225 [Chlamydiae bacterium CG10_big_fil_rev_8_21_14_0_10_42_34]|nr:MAG: hypothetical protein COT85_00225 [Chlamydiae bacterium CG10_big_fil_rev_8_21_14_0_10_42_34]